MRLWQRHGNTVDKPSPPQLTHPSRLPCLIDCRRLRSAVTGASRACGSRGECLLTPAGCFGGHCFSCGCCFVFYSGRLPHAAALHSPANQPMVGLNCHTCRPRRGKLGAQHTLWDAPVLMRHTIDSMDKSGFANITGGRSASLARLCTSWRPPPLRTWLSHKDASVCVCVCATCCGCCPPTHPLTHPTTRPRSAAVYGVPTSAGRCRALVRQPFKFKNKLLSLPFKLLPEWHRWVVPGPGGGGRALLLGLAACHLIEGLVWVVC